MSNLFRLDKVEKKTVLRITHDSRFIREREAAYMSVEASILMPVVFMVFLFILYSFFYTYDHSLAQLDMGHLLVKANVRDGEVEQISRLLQEEEKAVSMEKYYGYERTQMQSTIDRGSIRLLQKGGLIFPSIRDWSFTVEYEIPFYHPIRNLRQWKRLNNLKSNIMEKG